MRLALVSVTRGELVLREEVSPSQNSSHGGRHPCTGRQGGSTEILLLTIELSSEELVKMLLPPRAQSSDPQTMI